MSAIPSRFGWRKRALSTVLLAAFASAPAMAQTEISNLPLVLNVTAAPNVLMILDNSGSMDYESLPDYFRDIWGFELAMRHASASVYMPDYDDLNIFNLALRSSSLNRIYYNPNVTYRTWTKADGSSYDQSPPTAAPIRPGSGTTINLTTEKSHTFRWLTNVSTSTFSANGSTLPRFSVCPDDPFDRVRPEDNTCPRTYAPMTFFVHKGTGSINERANYYRYRIVDNTASRKDMADGTETAVTSFTWAGGVTRTLDQEKQNFANWYTYSRSRLNAAKGGVSYGKSVV